MEDYPRINQLFDDLRGLVTDPLQVDALEGKYFGDGFPSHEFSYMSGMTDVLDLVKLLKDRPNGFDTIKELGDKLIEVMVERGYRQDILTHQEHLLGGSSGSGLGHGTLNPHEHPYTVGGILSGDITVEEARIARALEKYGGGIGKQWGLDGWVTVLLSPIDDQGNTIGEPRVVDPEDNDRVLADKLTDDTPYKQK